MKKYLICFLVLVCGSVFTADHPVVFLICNPRTASTAFERSFIERKDFQILHEPFLQCAAYQEYGDKAFNKHDEGVFDKSMSFDELKLHILGCAKENPVFVKDMVYATYNSLISDPEFVARTNVKFVFLIRDPAKVLFSYYNKLSQHISWLIPRIPDLQRFDLQLELIEYVQSIKNEAPVVIDADDLMNSPKPMMQELCKRLEIRFIEKALTWEPLMPKEWESWSGFHDDVSTSTCFRAPPRVAATKDDLLKIPEPDRPLIVGLYEKMHPCYLSMWDMRLRITD